MNITGHVEYMTGDVMDVCGCYDMIDAIGLHNVRNAVKCYESK